MDKYLDELIKILIIHTCLILDNKNESKIDKYL